MSFRKFALNNVLRNKRLYIAYFLSSMFTVMVFFTFVNFAFHPGLTGGDMNANVTQGMTVAGGIIYVFSFFFILYSMSSFLQSRKKEFGLLMMQGMSDQQIRLMVFLENMVIGFFATIMGIGIGLVFSKLILLIAEKLLEIEGQLNFYFPLKALAVTFGSFMILFFFISIFVTVVLRTNKLVKLIKGDKIGKTEPKASIWLTIVAVLLLGSGYAISLIVKGVGVVLALFPVAFIVTIGTYLLFTQLSVYVIKKLKARKGLFWKNTNMLLFSDLSHRMKDNARAFFMVAIISTVAFSAIGTLVGLNSWLTDGMKEANPYSFSYSPEDKGEITEIEKTFKKYDLKTDKAEGELTYFDQDEDTQILITTPEVYNQFAVLAGEKEITLQPDEITVVRQSSANMLTEAKGWKNKPIVLDNGEKLYPNHDGAEPNVLPEMYHYYIVGEDIYEQLGEPAEVRSHNSWQVVNGDKDHLIEAGKELTQEYLGLTAIDFFIYDVHKMWSPIMFVGLFIGIVFFVSAGSFLYFRLYTDLDEDRTKFTAISKIGLTSGEMNRVISKQIGLLFFAPILVAIVHGAVALTALSRMFGYNLTQDAMLVLGSFLVIQIVYFTVVRYFYVKQVKQHVNA